MLCRIQPLRFRVAGQAGAEDEPRRVSLHLQWLLEGETEQQLAELSSPVTAQPGDTEDVPSRCCGSSLPRGLRCSFPSTNPFSSAPGDTQLWPRRVRDHHPLGLCHGSSPALRQHPAGAAPAPAPLVRRPLPRDPRDSSSSEITAGRCE